MKPRTPANSRSPKEFRALRQPHHDQGPIASRNDRGAPLLHPARDVAKMFGVKVDTLRKWRISGRGPAFIKEGRRIILYPQKAIDEWVARSTTRVQIVEPNRRRSRGGRPRQLDDQESTDIPT